MYSITNTPCRRVHVGLKESYLGDSNCTVATYIFMNNALNRRESYNKY